MKTLFLPLFFLIIFSSPAFCEDDPGFMWLEQMGRGHSMSSTAGKQGEKNAQKMDMAAMMKKAAEQSKNEGDNKNIKKKKRPAMSRPAKFLLKAGKFRADNKNLKPSWLADSSCFIQVPGGSIHELQPKKNRSGYSLYDEALAGGFYQMFAYNDIGVKNGIRYQLFSQYRFRNYGSEKITDSQNIEEPDIIRPGFLNSHPRFRLIDVMGDTSNDRYADRKYTGEELVLQLLLDDKPVVNAEVTVTSSLGWKNTARTDEHGKAAFTLIKEKFHGNGVNKIPSPYLVTAEYMLHEKGIYQNKHYDRQTFRVARHFSVRPTPLDWKSKQLGFLTVTGCGVAVMFAAGIRRRKRNWYESR